MGRMTFNLVSAAAIALVATGAAEGASISLHLAPGLWEMTSSAQMSGMPSLPENVLAQLPPAQRAKIEAQYQASMAQAAKPHTVKTCVTQKDLDHPFHGMEDGRGMNCSETVTSSTWTSQVVHVACKGGQGLADGTFHFQAPTPNSMQGLIELNFVGNGHSINTKAQIQGHWLGADCGSLGSSSD